MRCANLGQPAVAHPFAQKTRRFAIQPFYRTICILQICLKDYPIAANYRLWFCKSCAHLLSPLTQGRELKLTVPFTVDFKHPVAPHTGA